jgi:DNA mismatch repair protein MutH
MVFDVDHMCGVVLWIRVTEGKSLPLARRCSCSSKPSYEAYCQA